MLCSKISVPDCVDRTVYCVNPPSSITGGDIIIDENPSPYYKKKSKLHIFFKSASSLLKPTSKSCFLSFFFFSHFRIFICFLFPWTCTDPDRPVLTRADPY